MSNSHPLVEHDAIHKHFSLSYANYMVFHRTLLQSMPQEWQSKFVALVDQIDDAFRHVPQAEVYDVTAATEHEVSDLDDAQLADLGIVQDWYRGETPPAELTGVDLSEWQEQHEDPEGPTYWRDGEELERDERVLIPTADPVPHYSRGRTFIRPQPGLPNVWYSPKSGTPFDLHASYPVSRDQYEVLLKGEDHGYEGLVWRHYGEFSDGVPLLLAVPAALSSPDLEGDEDRVEGSIKFTDYEEV